MDTLRQLGINVQFPFVLSLAGLIWVRVLSLFSVVPFLFSKPVPRSLRLGASVMFTLFLYPIVVTKGMEVPDIAQHTLFILYLKETFFGLSIGFMASLIFHGFQAAGQMIDNQRGVSLARILIPALGEQASISSNFLFQLSVVLFLVLGGHRIFLASFVESYQYLPLLEFPQSVEGLMPLMELFMVTTGKVIVLAVQISTPVIIVILMTDIILGVANRFAPQINVWELGFNIRGYVGILILFLSLTLIARQVERYTEQMNIDVIDALHLMQGKPTGAKKNP